MPVTTGHAHRAQTTLTVVMMPCQDSQGITAFLLALSGIDRQDRFTIFSEILDLSIPIARSRADFAGKHSCAPAGWQAAGEALLSQELHGQSSERRELVSEEISVGHLAVVVEDLYSLCCGDGLDFVLVEAAVVVVKLFDLCQLLVFEPWDM